MRDRCARAKNGKAMGLCQELVMWAILITGSLTVVTGGVAFALSRVAH